MKIFPIQGVNILYIFHTICNFYRTMSIDQFGLEFEQFRCIVKHSKFISCTQNQCSICKFLSNDDKSGVCGYLALQSIVTSIAIVWIILVYEIEKKTILTKETNCVLTG